MSEAGTEGNAWEASCREQGEWAHEAWGMRSELNEAMGSCHENYYFLLFSNASTEGKWSEIHFKKPQYC